MSYGTKPKAKPKAENLTFNKAKNSWLDSWRGKVGYPKAKRLIDIIRNDYLAGDNERWEQWKNTPLKEMDEEFVKFTVGFINNVKNEELRSDLLFMMDSFASYANHNLVKNTTIYSMLLKQTILTGMSIRIGHYGHEDDEEEYEVYDLDELDFDDINMEEWG